MPYIGNVAVDFNVDTHNITNSAVTAVKLSPSVGSNGQVLSVDANGNLQWSADASGTSLSGSTNNTITTVTGANAIQGEANLTFDGSALSVTATTGQANLRVGSGNAGGAALLLDGDSNGDWSGSDYSYIRHRDDGNLEIVVDNPANAGSIKFHVPTEVLEIGSTGLVTIKGNNGNAAFTHLKFINTDNTASGETGQTSDIEFFFTDNVGNSYKGAKISAYKQNDWVGNVDYDAGLTFSTVDNSASFENAYTERLRITSDGKVGINQSSPFYPIHINTAMGSSPSWIHVEMTGSNTVGGGGGIAFDTSASNSASNNGLFLATVSGERSASDDGSNSLVFKTSKNGVDGDDGVEATPLTKMVITEDGKIGFNTTTIREQLHSHKTDSAENYIRFTNTGTGTAAGDGFNVGINGDEWGLIWQKENLGILIGTNGSERVRIDAAGDVLIGTTTSAGKLTVDSGTSNTCATFQSSDAGAGINVKDNSARSSIEQNGASLKISSDTGAELANSDIRMQVDGSTKLTIDSNGDVGIATTSPSARLHIDTSHYVPTSSGKATTGIHLDGTSGNAGERGGGISFACGATGAAAVCAHQISADADQVALAIYTHNSSTGSDDAVERMRIGHSVASVYTGITDNEVSVASSSTSQVGATLNGGGSANYHIFAANNSPIFYLCRRATDGTLVNFYQDTSNEGNISVSGSTVSYNGGHLSRWSQLDGISATDKSTRPTIYMGTVMSNLDKMCEWKHEETLYEDGDTIPTGKSVGDVKEAAHTEENQQLNMTKVSDTVGDKDVAGVFWTWDDEDDEYVNDFYIAMTGDMIIRVAGSTTVARGDLLESAGDGTAKPQSDDIVRSKTIAKITSTNFTATYPDGSKAYPCVLMAC